MKKSKNTKNESFNTLKSREIESITWKVKKAWEICEKPFGRDEKPWVSSIMQKRRSLYNGDVLPKESLFLFTSLSYPNFLAFLLDSLGSCPNCLAICSSYSTRNVAECMRIGVKP